MQVVNHSTARSNSVAYTAMQGTGSSLNQPSPIDQNSRSFGRAASSRQRALLQLEAENMTLNGYVRQASRIASGRSAIRLAGNTGTASTRFTGASGQYNVTLRYFDENDGNSAFSVRVGNSAIGSFTANRNFGSAEPTQRTLTTRTIANVKINNGQMISVRGVKNAGELAHLDYITLTPVLAARQAPPATSGTLSPAAANPFSNEFSAGWQTRWGMKKSGSWGQQNMRVIRDETGRFGTVLRVTYPAGSASPTVTRKSQAPVGGAQFYADMGMAPQTSARLSYYVRFSNNFKFVKGGKLPGLYGGIGNSGGNIPNGTDGFSTRFMWRTGGQGEVYAYLPTSQKHGTSLDRGAWLFKPGAWHQIQQQVTLNQPGQRNGQVKVWLNGTLVAQEGGLTFRTTDSLKINGLFFSTFFGGNDSSWASPQTVYADFARFSMTPA